MQESKEYDRGYRAFQAGVSITKNPYLASSEEAKEWASGWEDAANEDFYDEEENQSQDKDL